MKSPYKHLNALVGQKTLKREFGFFLDGYRKTNYFPSSIVAGVRGTGKTEMAKAIAAELEAIEFAKGNKQGKKFLEVNAIEIKTADVFFTHIMPYVLDHQYITLFIDEVSELPLSVQKLFLTVLNPTDNHQTKYFEANGTEHTFDFKKITFISATTNAAAVHPDLLDRLHRFEMDEYAPGELATIIRTRLYDVRFEDSALHSLSTTLRGNARQAMHCVNNIKTMGVKKFGDREFETMRQTLSIFPLGLNKQEVRYLQELGRANRLSLTDLCSRLSLTKEAVMGDVEVYPRKQGLIAIEKTGRALTTLGRNILKEIKEVGVGA